MSRSARRVAASRTAASALAATLITALAPGPTQAARTVSEFYVVPGNGRLALTGHGFGHGHGMSQYGAQGAAKQGLTARQILSFYYPGTTPATTSGSIRVLISDDTDNDVQVLPAAGLSVRDTRDASTHVLPRTGGIRTWRLRSVGGRTVLDYNDGTWHTYLPGGKAIAGDGEFFGNGPLVLRVAGTTRTYRGALRLSSSDTVNVVSMDDYVKGVVPSEMPASWLPAAVQAQAVAARTYGAFDRAAHPTRHYQTCDTTSCQVYGGVNREDSRSNVAVDATRNQVLNYQGAPAFTEFGSSSGGWLEAGSKPYLVAKADPYDGYTGNPVHTWTATITSSAVQKAYPSLGTLQRVLVTQRDGNGEWAGRVEKMTLDGSRANVALTGSAFRSKFGLRSQWFHLGAATDTTPPTTPPPTPPTSAPTSPSALPVTTPSPAPAAATPITLRWRVIGGYRSQLGRATSAEYALPGGRERRFQHGRIYWKAGVGAHELTGRVLKAYLSPRDVLEARIPAHVREPVQTRHLRTVRARHPDGVPIPPGQGGLPALTGARRHCDEGPAEHPAVLHPGRQRSGARQSFEPHSARERVGDKTPAGWKSRSARDGGGGRSSAVAREWSRSVTGPPCPSPRAVVSLLADDRASGPEWGPQRPDRGDTR